MKSLFKLILLAVFLYTPIGLSLADANKIGDQVLHALDQGERKIPVITVMNPIQIISTDSWNKPSQAEIKYQMQSKALETQAHLRGFVNDWIEATNFGDEAAISNYTFLWSTNAFIGEVDADLIWEMAGVEGVQKITYDVEVHLNSPAKGGDNEAGDEVLGDSEFTYGLERIGVPELRSEFPEVQGEGVTIGILDTGIDPDHPELKGSVVAWKDFISNKEKPYDGNGHGTHVAGTIAGRGVTGTQIGVAPAAQLVIGKILSDRGSGRLSGIIQGMQWMIEPNGDESLRPRVVNNSWGGGAPADIRENPFAQQVVAWVQMDIFPSFAAGNSGPGRSTIGSPGNLPMSVAVAATDASDKIAYFSSRGPVRVTDKDGKEYTIVKPDIAAPGYKILSTMPGGKYQKLSGTSMAAPHISGALALVYQANPNLDIEQAISILENTSEDFGDVGKDNVFGEGRLDIYEAIRSIAYSGSYNSY